MRGALLLLVLLVALVAWPAAASAAELPDCDPATNAAANVWDGTAGLWSDPQRWSLGHVPTATEDACALEGAMPGFDEDVHVRSLVGMGTLALPTSTRAQFVAAALIAISPGSTLRLDGAGLVGSGEWHVDGTLATDAGAVIDGTVVGLHGTTTLASGGALRVGSIDVDDLVLGAGTELSADGSMRIRQLVNGQPGARIDATRVGLEFGEDGAPSSLAADVAGSVVTHGDVVVSAQVHDGGFQVQSGGVELRGATVTGSWLVLHGRDRDVFRVTGGTHLDVETLSGPSIELDACTTSSRFLALSAVWLTVRDVDCVDPPPGLERHLGPQAAPVTFDGDGVLDAGGTLRVPGLELTGGSHLTFAGTGFRPTVSAQVGMSGAGVATITGLSFPDGRAEVGTGQLLRLEEPRPDLDAGGQCLQFAVARGGGRIEVHTATPRPVCVGWEDVSTGSQPIRYVAAGAPHEPRREMVHLSDTTWTPDGIARAGSLGGSGTVAGAVDVDRLYATGGALRLTGDVVARSLFVGMGASSHGVIDLREARSQQLSGALALSAWPGPLPAPLGASWTVAPGIASPLPVETYRLDVAAGSTAQLEVGTGRVFIAPPPVVPTTVPPPTVEHPIDATPPPRPPSWISWIGTAANDRRSGYEGDDTLVGRGGNDVLRGLAGRDRLDGGVGNDLLYGGPGNDALYGGPGRDRLVGGGGADRIACGPGLRDTVLGGPGADVVSCRNRRGGDVVDCGPGRDRATVDRGDLTRRCERVTRR